LIGKRKKKNQKEKIENRNKVLLAGIVACVHETSLKLGVGAFVDPFTSARAKFRYSSRLNG
jgi:hypothetical protein